MNQLLLSGIDGQHLWGFLTALGILSLLDEDTHERSHDPPRLAFNDDGAAVLHSPVVKDQLPAALLTRLRAIQPYLNKALAEIDRPSDFTRSSYERIALENITSSAVDLVAGLACVVGDDVCESTLCAANGASHQNLVQAMRDVLQLVDESHVRVALFEPWTNSFHLPKSDPTRRQLGLGDRKPTLRLDPSDERLYALRFSNPTTTDDYATELGAQALAIPAFALLPVVPSRRPATVASQRSGQRVTFSWMLWNLPATLRTVRSLVWEGVGRPTTQRERGIFAAFSADRVSGSKGKLSFAPSRAVW